MGTTDYLAFGLKIRSEIRLTAMPAAIDGTPDVTIRYGSFFGVQRPSGAMQLLKCTPGTICIYWPKIGAFASHLGRDIIIDPDAGMSEGTIADWVQSSAFAIALHQRGYLILHASAVVIDGKAVAFAGEVGQGKSTTASAFHASGHEMLTDDLVVIDTSGRGPMVLPGFPHVKLMNQAAAHFGIDSSTLQVLVGDAGKGLRRLETGFCTQPIPLGAVCFLEDGESIDLTALPPQQALTNLMRHAFVARMTAFLDQTATTEKHFHACTQIVRRARLMALRRPRDLSQLPRLVDSVRSHFSRRKEAA